ncbi:MAG TPA: UrcA family protein [Steroidobacteraceae bacterium]|jgi:UrcA family protein|nr:UrcA family protein [Steroidobacteraceae bacterium]
MKTSIRIQFAARCLGLALIGGALPGSQAFAAEPTDPPSIRVKYGDLNLQTAAGVEALYKRIHSAATQVCDSGGDRNLSILTYDRKCAAAAETQAIEKVNNASLSAFYQRKVGGPNAVVAMSNGK